MNVAEVVAALADAGLVGIGFLLLRFGARWMELAYVERRAKRESELQALREQREAIVRSLQEQVKQLTEENHYLRHFPARPKKGLDK